MGFGRNPEAEAGEEEKERQERISREEKVTAAEGIDGVYGRDRKDPVDEAKAQRGTESGDGRIAAAEEYLRRIIGDNVDPTELQWMRLLAITDLHSKETKGLNLLVLPAAET